MIRIASGMSIYEDKCLILADSLRRLGFEAEVEASIPRRRLSRDQRRDDLWIGYWNQVPARRIPRRYIALQTEPMRARSAWWAEQASWIPMIEGALEIWDYQESNRSVIESLGQSFHYVPLGFSPLHEAWFRRASAQVSEPDIDVLFVGGMVPRRQRVIDDLQSAGVRVEVVTYANVAVGADLHRLLARAKLMIGIHRYDEVDAQMLDLFRFDMALANAVPILHERVDATSEFDEPFMERVPFYEIDTVVDAVRSRLDALDLARAEAEQTKQWFRDEFLIDQFIPVESLRRTLEAI